MTELLLQREDGYAVLTLNRPDARNALSPQLLLDLCDAFRLLQDESDIYSVILTGAGTAFCAGLDLKAMAEDESGLGVYAIHAQHDITAAMTAFDRPIIVGVNGVAATGGFELALMGDILLASSGARFADTHCRVGLAPGWGLSQKLARIIGPSRAREAHFTGNVISAQQAEAWGSSESCSGSRGSARRVSPGRDGYCELRAGNSKGLQENGKRRLADGSGCGAGHGAQCDDRC